VQGLVFSGLNSTCQVSSKYIQVSEIFLAKTTFLIIILIGDPIGYRFADNDSSLITALVIYMNFCSPNNGSKQQAKKNEKKMKLRLS